jgi:hypothetical protein
VGDCKIQKMFADLVALVKCDESSPDLFHTKLATKHSPVGRNVLMKSFKIVFEAMINILSFPGFECVTDRIHKLHNWHHKLFGAGSIAFHLLTRYVLEKSN